MLVATLVLTTAAAGLLAAGLWLSSAPLLTASIAASVLSALVLVAGTWRGTGVPVPGEPPGGPPRQPAPTDSVDAAGPRAAPENTPVSAARPPAPVADRPPTDPPPVPADEPAPQALSAEDAARVAVMTAEVLVIDGRPRYHLAHCVHLLGRESEVLPASEAATVGFTPCSLCEPASALLAQVYGAS